jgi:hypothetical protein
VEGEGIDRLASDVRAGFACVDDALDAELTVVAAAIAELDGDIDVLLTWGDAGRYLVDSAWSDRTSTPARTSSPSGEYQ